MTQPAGDERVSVGALFAGYGGLELGISQVLDTDVTWVADNAKAPSRILAQRFPDVPNLGDVTAIDWSTVPRVDVLSGGTPCQDLSHAGKRLGMRAGTRSGLWVSMCDAIETLRPRLVLWENVRGSLSARADSAVEPCPICMGDGNRITLRALGRVLGDLAEIGYDAAWCGLHAADVGAPHLRFRVFVLAWPAAQPTNLRRQWDRAARDRWTRPAYSSGRAVALLPTPAVNDMGTGKTLEWWDEWAPRQKAWDGREAPHGKSLTIEALRINPTRTGPYGPYTPAMDRWAATLGRPAPDPTEVARGGAGRLSPRFVEFLMGLPAGWVTDTPGVTYSQQLRALGNGVVPHQAAAALRHLLGIRAAMIEQDTQPCT